LPQDDLAATKDGIVAGVESSSTAGPGSIHGARLAWRRTVLAVLLPALVLTITVTVVGGSRPASADQVASLQAVAARLSQQLLLEQLQIGGFEQQYTADQQKVAADQALVARTQARIDRTDRRIAIDRRHLANVAIDAYTSSAAVMPGNGVALFEGDQQSIQNRMEYAQLSVADVSTAVDQLHQDEHVLDALLGSQRQLEAEDQATSAQEGVLTGEAQATQRSLQAQQAQVTGQLAVAVAQQRQSEAQAAAAAIAAAQAAARRAAASAPSTAPAGSGVTGAAGPTTAGAPPAAPAAAGGTAPALPPFLQCVLQAESGGNYGAVSPNGQYMGGFQFSQASWNAAAQLAGRPDLVGVPPNQASPADQNALAIALYTADGQAPWYDPCRTA
jgi:hypothetical protein